MLNPSSISRLTEDMEKVTKLYKEMMFWRNDMKFKNPLLVVTDMETLESRLEFIENKEVGFGTSNVEYRVQ